MKNNRVCRFRFAKDTILINLEKSIKNNKLDKAGIINLL
jgi:hypothetical protein